MAENDVNSNSIEDYLNLYAKMDESNPYSQTLSTRVDKHTYAALTRLANDWGLSQSEALRRIVFSFTLPEYLCNNMEQMSKLEKRNGPYPLWPEGIEGDFHKFELMSGRQSSLRKKLLACLAEVDMWEARMQSALEAMKDYLKKNPLIPTKGGDETKE